MSRSAWAWAASGAGMRPTMLLAILSINSGTICSGLFVSDEGPPVGSPKKYSAGMGTWHGRSLIRASLSGDAHRAVDMLESAWMDAEQSRSQSAITTCNVRAAQCVPNLRLTGGGKKLVVVSAHGRADAGVSEVNVSKLGLARRATILARMNPSCMSCSNVSKGYVYARQPLAIFRNRENATSHRANSLRTVCLCLDTCACGKQQ